MRVCLRSMPACAGRLLLWLPLWLAMSAGLEVGSSTASGPDLAFAPGQVVVKFAPGVIDLPVNPGVRVIPLADVPITQIGLRSILEELGISGFEIIGREWRGIDPRPEPPESPPDTWPARLESFRNWYVLHFPVATPLADVVSNLRDCPGVLRVGRNPILELASWPVDTLLSCPGGTCGRNYQWNFENTGGAVHDVPCSTGVDIGLREAYDVQQVCTTKIGMLDSGIDTDHDDLHDNIDFDLGRNFTTDGDSLDLEDDQGHGTKSAGIVGAINSDDSLGVAGICGYFEDPVIVPLRIWEGSGNTALSVATGMVNALSYSAVLMPEIPILVLEAIIPACKYYVTPGCLESDDLEVFKAAAFNAYESGLFLAAASGNDPVGSNALGIYPVDFKRLVVGVTAIGCDGSRDSSLALGSDRIDLSAPGSARDGSSTSSGIGQIVTTKRGGGYAVDNDSLFGLTSAAVPHVGGIAGLIKSHNPDTTNEDIESLLEATAMDLGGTATLYGHGLVRADSALAQLERYTLVHDLTDAIDQVTLVKACKWIGFKNVPPWDTEDVTWVKVDLYSVETTVDLPANVNDDHTPMVWVRGRQSNLARRIEPLVNQSPDAIYDGLLEPYYGEVIDTTWNTATLRGYTYKLYHDQACLSFWMWYPINPFASNQPTTFSFSYLADETQPKRGGNAGGSGERSGRLMWVTSGAAVRMPYVARMGQSTLLEVFDAEGRMISSSQAPPGVEGRHEMVWSPQGADGNRLPAGVYFGRLRTGSEERRLRVIVVR
jgi:subtilisin family serine protease